MKTEEQLQSMYIEAKSAYYEAKQRLSKILKDEKCLWKAVKNAEENICFHSTKVRMLEAILEVPTEHRIINLEITT